jgi:hypothetical protein
MNHARPEDFRALVRRWPECRLVFEASMNGHWLFEILERELSSERIVLANPFKTRIIAPGADQDRQGGRADSGRSVTRQAGPPRAYCRSGDPTDQGGAPPALFFRPPAHDAAQSHSSFAWPVHCLREFKAIAKKKGGAPVSDSSLLKRVAAVRDGPFMSRLTLGLPPGSLSSERMPEAPSLPINVRITPVRH